MSELPRAECRWNRLSHLVQGRRGASVKLIALDINVMFSHSHILFSNMPTALVISVYLTMGLSVYSGTGYSNSLLTVPI